METLTDWLLAAGSWTLRNSLESIVLIGLVAAIHWIGRDRISSRFRAALWAIVGIRLLLPIAPESGFSLFNFAPEINHSETETAHLVIDRAGASNPAPTMIEPVYAIESPIWTWQLALSGLWLIGAIAILSFAVLRQITTGRRVRQLPEVNAPQLRHLLKTSAKEAGVKHLPRLVESSQISGIAVFGGLWPSHVILPAGFSKRYSETEIHGIFLHELAHVRRGDLLWNWITLGIEAMHWFNPLVWWAGRQFLAERELVCDRFALNRLPTNHHLEYGHALLKTLEFGSRSFAPNPALVPFLSRKSEIKHRLHMIKKSHSISPLLQTLAAVIALAACAGTFTSALADDERRSAEGDNRSAGGDRQGPRDGERAGPRDGGDSAPARSGELKVTVLRDGVMIGGKKIPLVNLRGELEKNNASSALITAEPSAPFQNVSTVMNSLKSSGIRDVRVASGQSEGRVMGDGDSAGRTGPRDGDGAPRTGPRDGDGAARTGPRDGDGAARTGPRDGDGASQTGPRDGDGAPRTGPREGDVAARTMPREGDGAARTGPREGDGAARTGPREGDGRTSAEGAGDRSASAMDDRKINQLTRIYRVYDKNSDNAVTFEEWVAMKNYELTNDQRERERGWFNQADANGNEKMTLGEWIDWKASQGRRE